MPIPAMLLGAAVQGGSMILQNRLNKRAQDRAFEQNKQFWQERFDTEAKYNSPVQQKARMQAAGLNPALMYKSGAGGGGNVSGPSSQGKIAERYELGQLALQSAQVAKIVEDTKRTRAEKDYITSKTEGQGTSNKIAVQDLTIKQVQATNAPAQVKNMLNKQVADIMLQAEKLKTQAQDTQAKKNLNYKFEVLEKDMIEAGVDVTSGPFQTLKQWFLNTMNMENLQSYFPQGMEAIQQRYND
jgi:hypothetical protein